MQTWKALVVPFGPYLTCSWMIPISNSNSDLQLQLLTPTPSKCVGINWIERFVAGWFAAWLPWVLIWWSVIEIATRHWVKAWPNSTTLNSTNGISPFDPEWREKIDLFYHWDLCASAWEINTFFQSIVPNMRLPRAELTRSGSEAFFCQPSEFVIYGTLHCGIRTCRKNF